MFEIPCSESARNWAFAAALMRCLRLAALALATACGGVSAAPVDLGEAAATGHIGRSLSVLIESESPMSLDDARESERQGDFLRGRQDVIKFGIGSAPVWLHLDLDNPATFPVRRRLQIEAAWLDRIDVFLITGQRATERWMAGDGSAASEHPLAGLGYVFDLSLPPGRSELFVRVATPDPMLLPVRLLDPVQAETMRLGNIYGYGLLYGCLLVLIAYNTMLYFGLRERSFLDYALYLGSFVCLHLAYTGHGYAWLWPDLAGFQRFAIPGLMIAFGCFGLRFAFGFLDMRLSAPRVRRLSIAVAGIAAATFLLAALADQQATTVFVAFVFILAFTLLMVWMGLIAVRGGRVPSRYFLAAALVAMPGTAVTAMSVWRGVPFTPAGFHAIGWAFVGEGILLALALAYRMRTAHQARLRAEQLARIDPLTSLPNRRAFLEQAAPAWAIAKRTGRPLALLVADIDFFKRINDTCGHATGDEVLVAVARLLQAACRAGDIAARWGGEEFIILFPETDAGQATQVAERLRERIARLPVGSPGQEIVASASFGVAQRQAHEHIESLIREADDHLYRAKSAGRNCVFPAPLPALSS